MVRHRIICNGRIKKTGWQAFEKTRGFAVLFDERKDVLWKPDHGNGNRRNAVSQRGSPTRKLKSVRNAIHGVVQFRMIMRPESHLQIITDYVYWTRVCTSPMAR